MNIGDKINDCYMGGICELDNICHEGVIEAAGKDWVIVRDLELDQIVYCDYSLESLNKFLHED